MTTADHSSPHYRNCNICEAICGIEITVQDQDEYYEFLVTDDGPGIPPAFHTKIFQMFQTLKPRDEVEGSGMGLAIVQKVVEGQGGTVRVESDGIHRGTTMRFTWRKQ